MSRSTNVSRACLTACLMCVALPGAASAGTASVEIEEDIGRGGSGQYAIYRAAPGEANRVTARLSGRKDGTATATITDSAGVAPGPGCTRPDVADLRSVVCELGTEEFAGIAPRELRFELGDLNDQAAIQASPEATGTFEGGAGDDTLKAGDGLSPSASDFGLEGEFGAVLAGGPGDDMLVGGDQDDDFPSLGSARDGADTILAGRGSDLVSYYERVGAVRADLAGDRDDGARGERDRIVAAELLGGGSGDDLLVGNRAANGITGGSGTDRLVGGAGADSLDDTSDFAAKTRDSFSGGRGPDNITAGRGANRIAPGPGIDVVEAGAGNDVIAARDGSIDRISCDKGLDLVGADRFDFADSGCERIRRGGAVRAVPGFGEFFSPLGNLRDPVLPVNVACPLDAPRACRVFVALRGPRVRIASASKVIRRGTEVQVFLKPNAAGRRLLRRLSRDRDSTVPAMVTVVTKGRGGRRLVARKEGLLSGF